MGTFEINGGKKLSGELTPQGAKNEALQVLCAVLLTPEKVIMKNVPDIIGPPLKLHNGAFELIDKALLLLFNKHIHNFVKS